MRFIPATVIAVALSACTVDWTGDGDMCEAVFSVHSPTKASVAELAVNHWAVMLFDVANPAAVYRAESSSSNDITCVARKGRSYRAYAIVNYPTEGLGEFNPASIGNEGELLGYASYLSGNSPSGLVMFGYANLQNLPVSGTTHISISRLCSKVSILKITVNMEDAKYEAMTFTLDALYLTNVFTKSTFGDDEIPSADSPYWYNAMGWHGSGSVSSLDLLLGERGINTVIDNGASYTTPYCFYTYPNTVSQYDDHNDAEWSARCTRLVIESTLGGKKYYYPVTLPDMKRNHNYIIEEAIIRRPGSLDPEGEIPGALDINLSINEGTWDTEYNIYEET